jgi:hypothetical protein
MTCIEEKGELSTLTTLEPNIQSSHSQNKEIGSEGLNCTHIFFLPFLVNISKKNFITHIQSFNLTKDATNLVMGFERKR